MLKNRGRVEIAIGAGLTLGFAKTRRLLSNS